jgi:hypothetical protein
MTEHLKNVYTLNSQGERKLGQLLGQNKTDFYIDCLLDLESLKDQNDAAVIVYEGATVHFDDSDFDAMLIAN